MAGASEPVSTGRLVGGDLDGVAVEIQAGQQIVEMSPMVMFGEPTQDAAPRVWVYRYARVEDGPDGPEAIFEFLEQR
jgi:hypothetical protein